MNVRFIDVLTINVQRDPQEGARFDASPDVLVRQILATRTYLRQASLTSQFPTLEPSLFRSIFPLFTPTAIDLLVFWCNPSSRRHGYHHLFDVDLAPSENMVKSLLEKASRTAGRRNEESQREKEVLIHAIGASELASQESPIHIDQLIPIAKSGSDRLRFVEQLQLTLKLNLEMQRNRVSIHNTEQKLPNCKVYSGAFGSVFS